MGYYNPDAMVAEGPGTLLDEWMAYHRIQPFGSARGDLQAGMICATLKNIWANHCGEIGESSPGDFLMTFGEGEAKEPPSVEELEAKLMLWAQAVNASIEK